MGKKEDEHTLRVKKEMIRKLKKEHFKYHNHLNLSEWVKGYPDQDHNHNGVAEDVCKKMQESGEFICLVQRNVLAPNAPTYYVEKNLKKSWKEKYWAVIAIITYLTGVLTPIIEKSIERKIWPESSQSKEKPPLATDTSAKHKAH